MTKSFGPKINHYRTGKSIPKLDNGRPYGTNKEECSDIAKMLDLWSKSHRNFSTRGRGRINTAHLVMGCVGEYSEAFLWIGRTTGRFKTKAKGRVDSRQA